MTTVEPTAPSTGMASGAAASAAPPKHIVEILIEERCPKLVTSPLWPVYRAVLYPLLRQPEAVRLADKIAGMSARDIFDFMSAMLDCKVDVKGLEHVPKSGRVIIASTHPTGIPDGIAMYDALKTVRCDLAFYANRDAIRVAPKLDELLIPVEWVAAKRTRERTRETLHGTVKAFTDDRCVVLFPSGRIQFLDANKAQIEQDWQVSVATFARKYECPIVPAHMIARNSWLYYWFWKLNTELRDITLFNELLNKRGKRFGIIFGTPISPEELPDDVAAATAALREHAFVHMPAGRAWRAPPSDA